MTNPGQTALEPKGEKTSHMLGKLVRKKDGPMKEGGSLAKKVLKFGQDAEKNYDREAQLG